LPGDAAASRGSRVRVMLKVLDDQVLERCRTHRAESHIATPMPTATATATDTATATGIVDVGYLAANGYV